MESISHYEALLAIANCPAFLAKEKTVVCANNAATELGLSVGAPLTAYIPDILRKLNYIKAGQIHLQVSLNGHPVTATISRSGEYDLYYLVEEFDSPELKVLAATAGVLKTALSGAMICTAADKSASSALHRSLHQLQRTICNMEDAATFNRKRPMQTGVCDITALYNTMMQALAQRLSAAGISLEYTEVSRQILCLADKEHLERGIMNLIANAISYHAAPLTLKTELHCYSGQIQFSVRTASANKYAAICTDYRSTIETILPNSDIALGITIAKGAAFAHDGAISIDQPDGDSIRLIMSFPTNEGKVSDLRSPVRFPMDYTGGYDHILVEFSHILPESLY